MTSRDGLTWVEEELESARAELAHSVDRVDALVDLRSMLLGIANEAGVLTLTAEQLTFANEVDRARFHALAQRAQQPITDDERNTDAQA